jgi:hypothetical protein
MEFVGKNLVVEDCSTVVVVLGSPLYLDDKEPAFSMVDGYFPSDAHLHVGQDRSVFGVLGRANSLQDVVVHQGWFGDPYVSAAHQERVDRFWTLFLKLQGACLSTFCGDLATVFNAVRGGSPGIARESVEADHSSEGKLEMLRIVQDIGVADWITRDRAMNVGTTSPTHTVGTMKIGIRWEGAIDLDLYARPHDGAETLFFNHTQTPEGYYFKDHRSSPKREYEFIEFEQPVDVWKTRAWINFYAGRSRRGPSGEVRIEFDGRIFVGSFSLPAERGNRARSGRGQERYWTEVDVPALLLLTTNRPMPELSEVRR